MKKKIIYASLLLLLGALAYIIYLSVFNSNNLTKPIIEQFNPKLYKKLVDADCLTTIDKSKENDTYKVKLENYYCDKNMLVMSMGIDYKKSAKKVSPLFNLSNNETVLTTAGGENYELKDKYAYIVVPENSLNDKLDVNLEFADSFYEGMEKGKLNPIYMSMDVELIKTVADSELREFDIVDDKDDVVGSLTLSPYGMFMRLQDKSTGEKVCQKGGETITVKYNDGEEISSRSSALRDGYGVYVFNQSIELNGLKTDEDKFIISYYQIKADLEKLRSLSLKLRKKQ